MFTNSLKQDVKELKKSEQFVASILKSLYLTERLSHFLSSKHQQQTMCQHLFLRPVLKNVWSSWNILLKRWKICYKLLSITLLDPLPISSPGIWMCSRLYGPSKVIKCSVDVLHSVWCFQSPFEFLKSGLVQTILSILNRNLFNCSFLIQFQFNAVFIFLTDCSVWPSWPYTDSEDPGTGLACSQLAFILSECSLRRPVSFSVKHNSAANCAYAPPLKSGTVEEAVCWRVGWITGHC